MVFSDWKTIDTAPDSAAVETKIEDADGMRNVQCLVKRGALWWLPDGSMYVYYRPTHWRALTHQTELKHGD